uniref:Uncharacterized protein n=1 Tax=Timema cristinae TaxID=61476 RepID=A0A7R9CR78_TIMCR|nr:unnamed protein product [Timema cristinae]
MASESKVQGRPEAHAPCEGVLNWRLPRDVRDFKLCHVMLMLTGAERVTNSSAIAEQVCLFLRSHPEVLEKFVLEEVELEHLEQWMILRTQQPKNNSDATAIKGKSRAKPDLNRWKARRLCYLAAADVDGWTDKSSLVRIGCFAIVLT